MGKSAQVIPLNSGSPAAQTAPGAVAGSAAVAIAPALGPVPTASREGPVRDRRDPAARPRAEEHVRLGRAARAPRRAADRHAAGGGAGTRRSTATRSWSTSWPRASTTTASGPALGKPVSVFDVHKADYHVAGSDAAGIVWAVGSKVRRWKVGDEVVVHCNQDDGDDEECNGGDPMNSPSQRIWGYETPDGSFAQFCRVQSRQLMPRPRHLTWEESGCYVLTLATAYRMLFGHPPHSLKPGDNVLVWGAAGGLGSMAIQVIAASGGNAIAVISDEDKREFVESLGAKGAINRKNFDCWGQLPDIDDAEALRRLHEEGARVRQGDLGDHRQGRRRRHRVRASGRGDFPGLGLRGQARRHGGDLRRHVGLQPDPRCALPVDAPEAHAGQPFRQPQAGERRQPDGRDAARSTPACRRFLPGPTSRARTTR